MVEQGLWLQARQHGDPNGRLGMTNRLWGAVKVAAPVLFGLSVFAPSPMRAGMLRQLIDEKPMLIMSLCWIEGFIVGGFLVYWLLL